MVKILLCCAAGMSTSLLVSKMEEAAEKKGLESKIRAVSVADLESHIKDVDVVLVGPQIRFKLKYINTIAEEFSIPVSLINTVDYGRVDGEKVLKLALDLIERG
ncbi:PTS sugar transporter subunit IIB [Clostridium carnis]